MSPDSDGSESSAFGSTLPLLADLYLAQCRVEGKTPDTVRTYSLTMSALRRGVDAGLLPPDVAAWRAPMLVRFYDWLRQNGGRPLAAATLHQRQRGIKTFLTWCVAMEFIPKSPAQNIKNTIIPKTRLAYLAEDELHTLLAVLESDAGRSPTMAARNRAIVLLIYDAAPRLSEVCSLTVDDVRWEERIIHLEMGKGQKYRVLPLSDMVYVALAESVRRQRLVPGDPLFLTEEGRPITKTTVQRMVQRLGRRAGLGRPLGPHQLRRSFAIQSFNADASPRAVQEIMGHTDLRTTMHYAEQRDMRVAARHHKDFSPLNRAMKDKGKKR